MTYKAHHIPVPYRFQKWLHEILHGGELCFLRVEGEECNHTAVKVGLCPEHYLLVYNAARVAIENNERENQELRAFMKAITE